MLKRRQVFVIASLILCLVPCTLVAQTLSQPHREYIYENGRVIATEESGIYFSDVSASNASRDDISDLAAAGIVSERSYFYPTQTLTYGQMACWIIRALYGDSFSYPATPYFTDVPSSNTYFKYVQRLKQDAITDRSGTFGVGNGATKAEVAMHLVRAIFGLSFNYTVTAYYTDVTSGSAYFSYVQKIKDEGIETAVGTFSPNLVLTREAGALLLARAFFGRE